MSREGLIILCGIVVIYFITLITIWRLVSRSLDIKYQTNKIETDRLIKDTIIDNNAMDSLDILIKDTLDEYVILEIKPNDIYYINSAMEDKIREYMIDEVTKRISILLMKKLEYICNTEYIGTLIGKRVYFHVMDYVLEFNVNNKRPEKK